MRTVKQGRLETGEPREPHPVYTTERTIYSFIAVMNSADFISCRDTLRQVDK
jgi:hypothetical protein